MQAFTSSTFRPKAKANFYDNPEGRALGEAWAQVQTPQDVRRRVSEAADLAHRDPIYRMERFVQRYVAEENFARGIPAIEERRAQLDAMKPQPPQTPAGGTLNSIQASPPRNTMRERNGTWSPAAGRATICTVRCSAWACCPMC